MVDEHIQKSLRIKADLHNHLRSGSYMPDGIFNKVIDKVEKRLGTGGMIGLINLEDRRYEKFSRLKGYERQDFGNAVYIPEKDIVIVKGQEVQTLDGHLLVLGLMKDFRIKAGRTLEDTIKEARDNNGILIANEPFGKDGIGPALRNKPSYIDKLDAIEVHNGESNANKKAMNFYLRLHYSSHSNVGIGGLACSGGYSLHEIGKSFIEIDFPEYKKLFSSDELAEHLRKSVRRVRVSDFGKLHNCTAGALYHLLSLKLFEIMEKLKSRKRFEKHLNMLQSYL